MAQKGKASTTKKATTAKPTEKATVTRIKATDTKPKAAKSTIKTAAKAVAVKKEVVLKPKTKKQPLKAFLGYFVGAWYELRQVRWPDRRATWSLTAAVLLFTAFFVVLIVLLDAGAKLLFEQILK